MPFNNVAKEWSCSVERTRGALHTEIPVQFVIPASWNTLVLSVACENEIPAVVHVAHCQPGVHPISLAFLCWQGHHTCARPALPVPHFPWSDITCKSNVSLCPAGVGSRAGAWEQLLEQAGPRCLLGDLTLLASGGLMPSWGAVGLMLVMKPALNMTLFLQVLLGSESQLLSELSRSIFSLKYSGMRVRLEGRWLYWTALLRH